MISQDIYLFFQVFDLENIIIFDTSSPVVFLGYVNKSEVFFKAEEFGKKELNTKLPTLFKSISEKLPEILPARVIIGSGPGSFTGIKTGIAMFLSMLFAKGVEKIETISSGVFLNLLFPSTSDFNITVIPFNKGQFFASCFDRSGNIVLKETFITNPYRELDDTVAKLEGKEVTVIAPFLLEPSLKNYLASKKVRFNIADSNFSFEPDKFRNLENQVTVNFKREPLLLNYMNLPANISNKTEIYINNCLEVENER
jgi:tRNA A37 threonylcarbamoyladenosine modification protein TsaB